MGRRAQICSPRCRVARWRQTRALETAGEIARDQTENSVLRQRVAELERLVDRLKGRLAPMGLGSPRHARAGYTVALVALSMGASGEGCS
jgi:hypothetical protein